MEYIDYDKDRMLDGHFLAPAFYKRKEFADERELRAVVDAFPVGDARRHGAKPLPTGHAIEVDLRRLITRVVLSPSPASDLFGSCCSVATYALVDLVVETVRQLNHSN